MSRIRPIFLLLVLAFLLLGCNISFCNSQGSSSPSVPPLYGWDKAGGAMLIIFVVPIGILVALLLIAGWVSDKPGRDYKPYRKHKTLFLALFGFFYLIDAVILQVSSGALSDPRTDLMTGLFRLLIMMLVFAGVIDLVYALFVHNNRGIFEKD